MILSNIRGLKSASYIVAIALIATLTFSLPLSADAKSRKSSKSSKVSKHSRGSKASSRGARKGSRGRVARGGRAAKGGNGKERLRWRLEAVKERRILHEPQARVPCRWSKSIGVKQGHSDAVIDDKGRSADNAELDKLVDDLRGAKMKLSRPPRIPCAPSHRYR